MTAAIRLNDNNGEEIKQSPAKRIRQLDEWTGTARPLWMTSTNPLYDDVKVFLMPLPTRSVDSAEKVNEHEYHVTLVLQQA